MSFKPSCVLVTGGAGFIGSNYLLRVVPRYPDTLFVNFDLLTYAGNLENLSEIESLENYRFEKGDVADEKRVADLFESYGFDAVVHFAAESHVDRSILDPTAFVQTNVNGTLVLLRVALSNWESDFNECRFHHVSTDEVFGSLGPQGAFTLDSAYAPRSPYAASKAAADHLVRSFGETYGLPYVLTNTSNNYGPYQFPEKLIPLVINNASLNLDIPVYGKGDNIRDWLFVDDHCEALDLVLRKGKNASTYLIGGQQEISNLDLIHMLLDEFDMSKGNPSGASRDLIRFVKDRPGHDFRYAIDNSRIQVELGWTPSHNLKDGLKRTVEWYLSNENWLKSVQDESYKSYYESQYGSR